VIEVTLELPSASLELTVRGERFEVYCATADRHLADGLAEPGPGVVARGELDSDGRPRVQQWSHPWCDPVHLDPQLAAALQLARDVRQVERAVRRGASPRPALELEDETHPTPLPALERAWRP
jgi:hypothetical protein